jgi:large subunit ribosomal protein L29
LFNLRFQTATGQLTNNHRLRTVRQEIARTYTVLRERELGLASGPNGEDS